MINKIDLVSAQPDKIAADMENLLGVPASQILRISAKEGTNIEQVLEAVVEQVPPPKGDAMRTWTGVARPALLRYPLSKR